MEMQFICDTQETCLLDHHFCVTGTKSVFYVKPLRRAHLHVERQRAVADFSRSRQKEILLITDNFHPQNRHQH